MPPELEKLLAEKGGLVAFSALFALKVGEMLWTYFRTREKVTDDSINQLKGLLEKNTLAMAGVQSEMQRLKMDLRRCFFAIKKLSGESWAKIADEMRDFPENY